MTYNMNDSIDKSTAILDILSKKQEALGSNIANMNTPGYVRKDINFSQVLGSLNSPIETKLSEKLGPSPFDESQNGKVNVTNELLEMQKNMLYYSVASRRITSVVNELKAITQLGK